MKRPLVVLVIIATALFCMTGAAAYIYEKSTIKGFGYYSMEKAIGTQDGYSGAKLVEKVSGSGNFFSRIEVETGRQIESGCDYAGRTDLLSGGKKMDYINYTSEMELEYMPVSYQTGTYDQKWIDKLCVQNYAIGAVLNEMYTHAEHLQKNTEVNTRLYGYNDLAYPCCTGVLEANINSNVIGVAHIGWLSRDPNPNEKGRHSEYGRSVEDLTGVFSVEKFIQLWGNSTCGEISVDWLPCI